MKTRMVTSFAVVASVALQATRVAGQPLVRDAELQRVGLSRFWDGRVPLSEHDAIQNAFLVEDALYVTTEAGILFAVKADVGLIRWAEKVSVEHFPVGRPTHISAAGGRDLVVVLAAGGVSLFDRVTGDLVRVVTTEFVPVSTPVGTGRTLFAGSLNGRVYALLVPADAALSPLKRWDVAVGAAISSGPALYAREKLLFADMSGAVYSCFAANKAFDWRYSTGAAVVAEPAFDESGVYIASTDRSLYKLDGRTGGLLWRHRFGCELREAPSVVGGTAFQTCSEEGLAALDAASGILRWRVRDAGVLAASLGDRDALFTNDGRLLIVDHETGAVSGSVEAGQVQMAVPNAWNDLVILLGRDGRMLCARPMNTPFLRAQQAEAERLRLNIAAVGASAAAGEEDKTGAEPAPAADDPLRSRRDVRP